MCFELVTCSTSCTLEYPAASQVMQKQLHSELISLKQFVYMYDICLRN